MAGVPPAMRAKGPDSAPSVEAPPWDGSPSSPATNLLNLFHIVLDTESIFGFEIQEFDSSLGACFSLLHCQPQSNSKNEDRQWDLVLQTVVFDILIIIFLSKRGRNSTGDITYLSTAWISLFTR